jgi:hypothetical protein
LNKLWFLPTKGLICIERLKLMVVTKKYCSHIMRVCLVQPYQHGSNTIAWQRWSWWSQKKLWLHLLHLFWDTEQLCATVANSDAIVFASSWSRSDLY